ncbi:MAG: hypothetical protein K2X66_16170 [Cyanobacteria bacterium]|nr:hypothetical protein [Cyanobacteriota bacterium]
MSIHSTVLRPLWLQDNVKDMFSPVGFFPSRKVENPSLPFYPVAHQDGFQRTAQAAITFQGNAKEVSTSPPICTYEQFSPLSKLHNRLSTRGNVFDIPSGRLESFKKLIKACLRKGFDEDASVAKALHFLAFVPVKEEVWNQSCKDMLEHLKKQSDFPFMLLLGIPQVFSKGQNTTHLEDLEKIVLGDPQLLKKMGGSTSVVLCGILKGFFAAPHPTMNPARRKSLNRLLEALVPKKQQITKKDYELIKQFALLDVPQPQWDAIFDTLIEMSAFSD